MKIYFNLSRLNLCRERTSIFSFIFLLCSFCFCLSLQAQDITLWDGEGINPASCDLQYGSLDNSSPYAGQNCFLATPDKYHRPAINLQCENTWRSDLSQYDEIQFYIKANISGATLNFGVYGWPNTSNFVSINQFVSGGVIDNQYRLARIPVSLLKTAQYKLQSVEYLFLDTSSVPGINVYIDNITAVDIQPDTITSYSWLSNNSVRLDVNRTFDTTSIKNRSYYSLSSTDDPNYPGETNPGKIGFQYYVTGFDANIPNPVIKNEIFLQFPYSLQPGKNYSLNIYNVKNRSGIDFNGPLRLPFQYNDYVNLNHSVKVNQVGYMDIGPKYGYIGNYLGSIGLMECSPANFQIIDKSNGSIAYTGIPVLRGYDPILNGEKVYECDFSALEKMGNYFLYVPGVGRSYDFNISDTVYNSTYYTTTRALYYQRCGIALQAPYAEGRFSRGICHEYDGIIHSSWSSSPLYNGEIINDTMKTTGGWHDAGDYGKYMANGTLAAWNILSMYELFPTRFYDGDLNIPESGNGVPDILDEAKWQIDGEINMQTSDGGVAERVITTYWPTDMPDKDTDPRYISEKTTFTTADYAAIMAMAYRCFQPYWPVYADTCLVRAKRAWQFLVLHPNPTPAGGYITAPGIGSGSYIDPEDSSERAWAAAELYKATGDPTYENAYFNYSGSYSGWFGYWNQVTFRYRNASLAYATTSNYPVDANRVNAIKNDFINNYIEPILVVQTDENLYRNACREDVLVYLGWGLDAHSTNYSRDFLIAYYFTNNQKYVDYAKVNLNTQLGDNAQDKSYITGVGKNYPMDPLHHPSLHDGVLEPVPGLPVFGPFAHMSDANVYDAAVQDPKNLYPSGAYEGDSYPIFRRYWDCHQNTGMSEFTIADISSDASVFGFFNKGKPPATLPIKDLDFKATKTENRSVLLNWQVDLSGEQINNLTLQKSEDGHTFFSIKSFGSKTGQQLKGIFMDTSKMGDNNYYRLSINTNTSKQYFSKIEYISFAYNDGAVQVFPVPSSNKIEIKWTLPIERPVISILDLNGNELKLPLQVKDGLAIVDISQLSKGVYIVKLKGLDKYYVLKFIKD